MMSKEEIETAIRDRFPEAVLGTGDARGIPILLIAPEYIRPVCEWLKYELGFDQPDCITAVDTGDHLEMVYLLYSFQHGSRVELKVSLDYNQPIIDSVTPVWKGANWQEREVFDLFGIEFRDHPDLRRILLPDDFEGYPLRKSYTETD